MFPVFHQVFGHPLIQRASSAVVRMKTGNTRAVAMSLCGAPKGTKISP
jgi:hypothetical protein